MELQRLKTLITIVSTHHTSDALKTFRDLKPDVRLDPDHRVLVGTFTVGVVYTASVRSEGYRIQTGVVPSSLRMLSYMSDRKAHPMPHIPSPDPASRAQARPQAGPGPDSASPCRETLRKVVPWPHRACGRGVQEPGRPPEQRSSPGCQR